MSASVPTPEVALGSGAMFDGIAHRYDLLNRLMSLGGDQAWRRRLVSALGPRPGERILDLATGTADVALAILSRQPGCRVVGVDPSNEMLNVGRAKAKAEMTRGALELAQGDAQDLQFPAASFEGATMAFGIRNVPDRPRALRELARVVKPGGRVCILELGEPPQGLMGSLARFHVHSVVPRLGSILSGAQAYSYLQASIARFPEPEVFNGVMAQCGLQVSPPASLSFGAVHLFVGTVPPPSAS